MSIEELLDGAAQLDTPKLEHLFSEVGALLAKRRAPHLSRDEAALLQKINQGLPPDVQQRYDTLIEKRQEETLTSDEHQELITMNDQIEEADAERVKNLATLAQLRQVSIKEDYTIIIGLTPTGRATVEALQMNRRGLVNLRQALFALGKHPPSSR